MRDAALLPLALLVGLSAGVGPAAAQGIDLSHGGPIAITSRDGIEWLQQQHEVIATGDARAVRGDVTITADQLVAFYRKKATPTSPGAAPSGTAPAKTTSPGATSPAATSPAATSPATAAAGAPGQASATLASAPAAPVTAPQAGGPLDPDEGGNEIYRMEAHGHVVIVTPTDRAQGDNAVYDLDQAVMVMTGGNLRLTTPNDILTSRDDMEYWSAKHMAVARGDAVVITKDHRRITADVLVAYTTPDNAPKPVAATKISAPKTSAPGTQDPLGDTGKLQKVEAFGHVVISTPTDVVTGDRGVYVPDTGIAVLVDHVRITRGQNQLAGSEAEVNLKSGVSRLLAGGGGKTQSGRVEGLLVPNQTEGAVADAPKAGARPNGAKRSGSRSDGARSDGARSTRTGS